MLKKNFIIISLLFLQIIISKAEQLSDKVTPESFDSISIEGQLPEIKNSLQNKIQGKKVISKNWMIVTANPYASVAGAEILEKGGTAADAMIAAQVVLGLVEPESSGLGGGAFLLYYDNNKNIITTLDGRETAPLNALSSRFQKENGQPMKFYDAAVGSLSVGTPGVPALLFEAHKRWGLLKWNDLFDNGILLSENGFFVSKKLSDSIKKDEKRLYNFKQTKDYFFPNGSALAHREIKKNKPYASTLRLIANTGIEEFYEGVIAQDILNTLKQSDIEKGFLEERDFKNYKIIERPPVCIKYKVYDICGMGPPSSGGIAVAQILGILEKFDLKSLGYSNPEAWQIIGDATRLAFADRGLYVADSDYVFVPTEALIDKEYLATRSDKIKPGKKTLDIRPGNPLLNHTLNYSKNFSIERPSTTHISIVDQYGNALSMTSSIENAFGSRIMTEGGFLLNNQLTDFSFKDQVNGKLIANRVQPGKRPRSSMSPTIILKDGNPILITGSPGGSNIISFVINSIIAFLEWDLDIQQSVSLPHAVNKWGKYEIEDSLDNTNLKQSLELMGYETSYKKYFSGLNAIYIGENLEGGTDPRREGIVLGK
jgi:gamma-glutamyltranspeptidase/glutathione hydrolase